MASCRCASTLTLFCTISKSYLGHASARSSHWLQRGRIVLIPMAYEGNDFNGVFCFSLVMHHNLGVWSCANANPGIPHLRSKAYLQMAHNLRYIFRACFGASRIDNDSHKAVAKFRIPCPWPADCPAPPTRTGVPMQFIRPIWPSPLASGTLHQNIHHDCPKRTSFLYLALISISPVARA